MKSRRHQMFGILLVALLTSCSSRATRTGNEAAPLAGEVAAEKDAVSGSDAREDAVVSTNEPEKSAQSDETDLAKKVQNPVANLISVPFQSNFNFGVGPDDGVQYVGNLQPVVPVKLGEAWNVINRPVIPLVYQPRSSDTQGSEWGLGDIQYQAYLSPAKPGKLIWGVGPVLGFPSATDDILGTEKWTAGPAFVALTIQGPWVLGANVLNQWSFAGDSDREHVNQFFLQPFVNFNLPRGWYLTASPAITANWKADSGEKWTVPVGGGVGKLLKLGNQPINLQVQAFGFPEKPKGGPEWALRFQFQLLF
jgi:hypothetical protein